jgi:hypothetical protein
MKNFVRIRLQRIQFFAVAISFLPAGVSTAALIVDFRGMDGIVSPGPATATVSLSDLENDPVTLSSPNQGGVFLSSAVNDSFPENDGYTGQINLIFQTGTVGAGGLANWDVTIDPNGNINPNTNGNGWGVGTGNATGTAANQISGNELLLFTFDANFSTTGLNKFIFGSARVGTGDWEIWHRTGATSGTLIISNSGNADVAPANTFEFSDGDMFAIQSVNGTNNRWRSLTIDMIVVPEPTAVGLASLALGVAMIVCRRRD